MGDYFTSTQSQDLPPARRSRERLRPRLLLLPPTQVAPFPLHFPRRRRLHRASLGLVHPHQASRATPITTLSRGNGPTATENLQNLSSKMEDMALRRRKMSWTSTWMTGKWWPCRSRSLCQRRRLSTELLLLLLLFVRNLGATISPT